MISFAAAKSMNKIRCLTVTYLHLTTIQFNTTRYRTILFKAQAKREKLEKIFPETHINSPPRGLK